MTLPRLSTLASHEFTHFDTMSYAQAFAEFEQQANAVQEQTPPASFQLATQEQPLKVPPTPTPPTNFATTVASASPTIFSGLELAVENVMPGIFLTKNFIAWNEENLRAHGFTHVIIIDKHIQELYYPSPVFKLCKEGSDAYEASPFEYHCQPPARSLSFGKEFEAINLNFGEKSYLTTVLPNCYRAVRFINKALQAGGTVLVIDCNGGEQKCVTIIVAYLMYKHNISFSNAFARLKDFYHKADLDRFYMSQLYEYEPILQVQRAQSRGHSSKLRSTVLKRKTSEDAFFGNDASNFLLNSFNPLSHFKAPTTDLLQCKQVSQQQKLANFGQAQSCEDIVME